MDLSAPNVFTVALEGCCKLQKEFPADERLRGIMSQLEQWKTSLTQQGQSMPTPGARLRMDPRDLRPLNEDLAQVVRRASMEASRLGLA